MSGEDQIQDRLTALTEKQQGELETWLTEDEPDLSAIITNCSRNFKVTVSEAELRNFQREIRLRHNLERIARCAADANALTRQFAEHPADTYQLLLSLSGQIAFELALKSEKSLDRKAILDFTKLLIAARRDDRDLEKRAFDREKWEFDAAEACLKKLPELKAVSTDSGLTFKEKLRQVRLRLFGIAPE